MPSGPAAREFPLCRIACETARGVKGVDVLSSGHRRSSLRLTRLAVGSDL